MFRHLVVAASAAVMLAAPAHAQTVSRMTTAPAVVPDAGFSRIEAGDLRTAEAALLRTRASHPDAPEVALNLAAIYVMTGRADQATPLYAKVLAEPELAMDMPSGEIVSSHDVARRGSARIRQVVASR